MFYALAVCFVAYTGLSVVALLVLGWQHNRLERSKA